MAEKIRYTIEDMMELYHQKYPYLVPTKQGAGRFAKANGFVVKKQKLNQKQVYFYVRKEDL